MIRVIPLLPPSNNLQRQRYLSKILRSLAGPKSCCPASRGWCLALSLKSLETDEFNEFLSCPTLERQKRLQVMRHENLRTCDKLIKLAFVVTVSPSGRPEDETLTLKDLGLPPATR